MLLLASLCSRAVARVPAPSELRSARTLISGPALARFRSRFNAYDRDGVEAGRTRAAGDSRLESGRYDSQGRAANNDGVWNEKSDRLASSFATASWQTPRFRGLMVLLFLASGPAFYFWRIGRLERCRIAQEAFSRKLIDSQERERKRIAAELHDSLGQNLLVIKNRAALALAYQHQPEKLMAQVAEISAVASAAIHEVREIAQNLRPFQLDEFGLTKSILAMARKLSESSQIEFKADLHDLDAALPPGLEIHLYRAVQESFSNVVKHSRATAATVQARVESGCIRLAITDNGCGWEAHGAKTDLTTGCGLGNITERVRTLGGTVAFDSSPGKGTRVEIVVPNKINGHPAALRSAEGSYRPRNATPSSATQEPGTEVFLRKD